MKGPPPPLLRRPDLIHFFSAQSQAKIGSACFPRLDSAPHTSLQVLVVPVSAGPDASDAGREAETGRTRP